MIPRLSAWIAPMRAGTWWEYKTPLLLGTLYASALAGGMPVDRVWPAALACVAALVPLASYVCVVNDITDERDDVRAGKTNRMAGRTVAFKAAWLAACLVGGLVACSTCFPGNTTAAGLYALNWLAFTLYSVPPIRLKSRGLPGALADASGGQLLPSLWGTLLVDAVAPPAFIAAVAVWSAALGLRGILSHQAGDIECDRAAGVGTLAVRLGAPRVDAVVSFLTFPLELTALGAMLWMSGSRYTLPLAALYGAFRLAMWWLRRESEFIVLPRARGVLALLGYYQLWFPLTGLLALADADLRALAAVAVHLVIFPGTWWRLRAFLAERGTVIVDQALARRSARRRSPTTNVAALSPSLSRFGTILFLTSCPLIWGGCEELWAGTAERLRGRGFRVRTGRSEDWPRGPFHPRWASLKLAGVGVNDFGVSGLGRAVSDAARRFFPAHTGTVRRVGSLVLATKIRLLRPELVVISQGQAYDGCVPNCLPDACRIAHVPYVLICQKAAEIHWPDDGHRELLRCCYREAAAVFFVSEHNKRTVELQLGMVLPAAEIVRNPFMVRSDAPLPWPAMPDGHLRLACVGRMWPLEKCQDVLLNVLARERWRARPIEVSFYGDGPMARGIEEMAAALGLTNVRFPGFTDPNEIWRTHHALVLPSRAEGLPLAQVEAMMCGRPVIVADAGGSGEIMRDGEHGFLASAATEAAVDEALERAWQRRDEWPAIGAAAAAHVRTLYPADPCSTFADRLIDLLGQVRRG